MSDYFSVSGNPATGALGASADIRAEFALVSDGFDKLPDLTTVANRVVHVNSCSTALVTTSGFTFDGTTFTAPALAVTNASTFTGAVTCNGTVTLGNAAADNITVTGTITSTLIFTDATYDIGASGATRPRDGFFSRNGVFGGTLGVTGVQTNAAHLAFSADSVIRRTTSDASDNGSLFLAGGGADGQTRGASTHLFGNEGSAPGTIRNFIGNVASSAFEVYDANTVLAFRVLGADGSVAISSNKQTGSVAVS